MTDAEAKKTRATPKGGYWDQRLARLLVRPFVRTRLHPNHVTTFRLLLGIAACGCFASGQIPWIHIGAGLFALSNFVDHMDGELARLSGKSSRFGHYYDLVCDFVIHVFLFIAIGYGLRESWLGMYALPMGAAAGVSVAGLFFMFQVLEKKLGERLARQPSFKGFHVEDVLYFIGPITWGGGLIVLLILAALGAPAFALWIIVKERRALFGKQQLEGSA